MKQTRTIEEIKTDMERVRAEILQAARDHDAGLVIYETMMERVHAYRKLLLEYRRATGKKFYVPDAIRLRKMMTQVPG